MVTKILTLLSMICSYQPDHLFQNCMSRMQTCVQSVERFRRPINEKIAACHYEIYGDYHCFEYLQKPGDGGSPEWFH